jgi:dihydrolipoamide dehydrogenase
LSINYKQIKINSKLQTTNPSIYSFRNSDGLKFDSNEIETILKNSLFLPIFYIKNSPITEIIHTKPSYIQIGYSEKDARKTFKKPILVGKNYFNSSLKHQIPGEGNGFIKLIAKTNLELIGATIVGNEAEEMVNLFSLLIAKKISLDKLLKITYPLLSNSYIIYQAALNAMHKVNKNRFDNWFIWRKL